VIDMTPEELAEELKTPLPDQIFTCIDPVLMYS
jgi:hypothetical protein